MTRSKNEEPSRAPRAVRGPRRLAVALGALAALASLAAVAFALTAPALRRSQADALVREARTVLSVPAGGSSDLDAVDCDRAAALLRQARALDPVRGRRELPLADGCASLLRGDLVLAEGELAAAVEQLRGDPRPFRWLGALELARGQAERARQRYEQALELDPAHAPARVGLSDALAELGRADEALEALGALPEPALAAVETRRGILLEALDRADEARAAYLEAVALDPTMPEPHNNLSALLRDAGELEGAWTHQRAALELAPDDPLMLRNAGLIALAIGRDEEGERLLRRAAELDSDAVDPIRALGDHLLVSGQAARARQVLGDAIERFPRDAALLNSLGNAMVAIGDAAGAQLVYRRAVEADGSLAQPHNGLAALALARGDLARAALELAEASRLDPDDPQVRRNLAELARRQAAVREGSDGQGRLASGPRGGARRAL